MRGKAQPDGRPALQIIETPFLLFATCGPTQRRFSINFWSLECNLCWQSSFCTCHTMAGINVKNRQRLDPRGPARHDGISITSVDS